MALQDAFGIDGKTYSGQEMRLLVAGLAENRGGVSGIGDLKATPNGTPDAKVQLAAGMAVVPATSGVLGAYEIPNDAGGLQSPSFAATGAQGRWDLLLLQVVAGVPTLVIVQGTAAGSPAEPSLAGLTDFIRIARIQMPPTTSVINNGAGGTIVDQRLLWMPYVPVTASTRPPNPFDGQTIIEVDTGRILRWVAASSVWVRTDSPYVDTAAAIAALAAPQRFTGLFALETDTGLARWYNGTDWPLIGTPNKRVTNLVPTGVRTINNASGTADWPGGVDGACTVTFTKRSAATRLAVRIDASFYLQTAAGVPVDFYVDIGGTDTLIINSYANEIGSHKGRAAGKEIAGLTAGVKTCKVQAAVGGAGVLTADGDTAVSLTVEEVL